MLKIAISKLQWKIPHLTIDDKTWLILYNTLNSSHPIKITFRSWDMYEYPVLPATTHHSWTVKTSNQLQKTRFVIIALQIARINRREIDASKFDHCRLTDVRVHLNSDTYPDLNLDFERDRYAILYNMYSKFQEAYYDGQQSQPLLSWADFKEYGAISVIDCSHQNESIKSGPVDIRIEFKTSVQIPADTKAYCLLLHDRIIEYNPFTSEVKKLT